MMSDITEEEWNRIREHFGDLAYECPEMHRQMLEILDMQDPDAALEMATKEVRADFAEGLSVRIASLNLTVTTVLRLRRRSRRPRRSWTALLMAPSNPGTRSKNKPPMTDLDDIEKAISALNRQVR
ncbi:UNVERIFIED_ORG: hypothetical protein GGI63_005243 [Rhizobium esperanzae]